jgi:hypothetical protein
MDIVTADKLQAAMYALHRMLEYGSNLSVKPTDLKRLRPAMEGLATVLIAAGFSPYHEILKVRQYAASLTRWKGPDGRTLQ